MLKNILNNLGYLVVMLGLGFAIYYFVLNPNSPYRNPQSNLDTFSTQALFAAQLPNVEGSNQDLGQYKGKVIVLNFWATWCPPCREEMPALSELYNEYKNKNVVVLGLAVDALDSVKTFTQESPVSYPIVASEEQGMAIGSGLGNAKGILPYTVIIDAKGHVVKTYYGRIDQAQIASALKPLLGK